ncbi:MAG: choice-of-anchor tandem repeat NxxGxxAF-containing protein [Pseudomonadota bacterium]
MRRRSRCSSLLALSLAVMTLAGCGGSDASTPGTLAIAVVGEPAPGLGDGYLFEGFATEYGMGASGQVIFQASANVNNGGPRERKTAMWYGQPESLKVIAEVGQPIPGAKDDNRISDFSLLPRIVTRNGTAVFVARGTNKLPGYQPQVLVAYRDGALEKIVANGDPIPVPDGDGRLLNISQYVAVDDGVLIMGTFARRKNALWYWDFSDLRLVVAEGTEVPVGEFDCKIRGLESTTIDINAAGLAVFRASMFGNNCRYSGIVGWDRQSDALIPVALNRTPIQAGTSLNFQSTTGDARVSDGGHIAIHAGIFDMEGRPGAMDSTLWQARAGGDSQILIDKQTPLPDAPALKLTHAIHDSGMAPVSGNELVHFVRNHHDRIILRTTIAESPAHELVAHTGTVVDETAATRIGTAHVNRSGDVVFVSYRRDEGRRSPIEQELWLSQRGSSLVRLTYPGAALVGREDQTIDRINFSNPSHEPRAFSTQGGRVRQISDDGAVLFAGRLQTGSNRPNALFVTRF